MMQFKFLFLASLLLSLIPMESKAVLGRQVSTVESDRILVQGQRNQVQESNDYSTNIVSSEANTIREYSNANGIIFAVTWKGAAHPDLSTLLGDHWAEFQKQHDQPENRNPQGRRILKLNTSTIQYEEGGRMGFVYGRAFVPSLVPNGVNVEELP